MMSLGTIFCIQNSQVATKYVKSYVARDLPAEHTFEHAYVGCLL